MEKISLAELFMNKLPIVEDMNDVMYQLTRFHNEKLELAKRKESLSGELEVVTQRLCEAEEAFDHYADLFIKYRGNGA